MVGRAARADLLLTSLLLLTCCGTALGQIRGAGATFPAPIYQRWFGEFQKAAGISVDYQAVGSGQGLNAIRNRTVDFGASDAPLTAEEESSLLAPVFHIPTVAGAVVITYNLPGIGSGLRFTPAIIAGIYLGKIKMWNDPQILAANYRKDLPALPIQPVHRTDGSGTTYIFTSYLSRVSPAWAAGPGAGKSVSWPVGLGGKGNPGVAAVVGRTRGALGYVELAYTISNHLPYGSVQNAAGNFVAPSVATTSAAVTQYVPQLKKNIKTPTVDAPGVNSYPICSFTYVLVNQHGGSNAAQVAKLWSWIMQPAQQQEATQLLYVPLPAALAQINLAHLKEVAGAGPGR